MPSALKPLFIHSLFRSGSTYVFSVFRRSAAGYWCYQEPFHEALNSLNDNPEQLLAYADEAARSLRHPPLSRPYFYESYEIREHLKGTFKPSFSYADFFADLEMGNSEDVKAYLGRLIAHAKGRPVLQFCRSGGRARALKAEFEALHLHLWRDPRDQWWSYKATPYFDATTQIIYQAKHLPPVLRRIREWTHLGDMPVDDCPRQFTHAIRNLLPSMENYLSFYGLWLYAFLECEAIADVSISIDRLSHDGSYRDSIVRALEERGTSGLDFSDCHIPRTEYQPRELEFFGDIERRVVAAFLEFGYSPSELRAAEEAQQTADRCLPHPNPDLSELAARARRLALDHATERAKTQRYLVEVERQLTARNTEWEQAQRYLVEVERQLTARNTEWEQAQRHLAEVERQLTARNTEWEQAQRHSAEVERQLTARNAEWEQAQRHLAEVERQLAARAAELAEIERQLSACQQVMQNRWYRTAAWMEAHSGRLGQLERWLRQVLRRD